MPTYAWLARFRADFDKLTRPQQAAFLLAVGQFVEDLRAARQFRKGLRVRGIQGASGIFEITWADDGRATEAVINIVPVYDTFEEWAEDR